ncbi:RNA methyltransferase [Fulvivirga sp. 29W222]|uniref:tRNA (guanosine(18)-2'-O)-methyltransferase n=1 Tax=Fulvivirga marina TaxID=2494733 RepID=A0A937FZW0_9BACT|nr:RNA methyltransferase [Fulvivirga marina]MBL6449114.1 RNA methyltransferase [Fulvivirga marina]
MDKTSLQLLDFLGKYVTEHKKALIDEVLSRRTRHLTFVLEDIYQSQNASAVVRTCDCFGIQDLHIIEDKHSFELNPRVVHGASKWINICSYQDKENNAAVCFDSLRENGYKIIATSPEKGCISLHDVDMTEPVALVFGTEITGISEFTKSEADELVTIPMYGFSESLNISVSAAICANILIEKLFRSEVNWGLTENEKNEIKLSWYRAIVGRSEILEKQFLKSVNHS